MRWQGFEIQKIVKPQKLNRMTKDEILQVSPTIAKPMLCAVILENMNHEFAQNKINKSDEFYTLDYAIKPLLNYIPSDKTIWCPFDKQESNSKEREEYYNTDLHKYILENKDKNKNHIYRDIKNNSLFSISFDNFTKKYKLSKQKFLNKNK